MMLSPNDYRILRFIKEEFGDTTTSLIELLTIFDNEAFDGHKTYNIIGRRFAFNDLLDFAPSICQSPISISCWVKACSLEIGNYYTIEALAPYPETELWVRLCSPHDAFYLPAAFFFTNFVISRKMVKKHICQFLEHSLVLK